jgi:uncharacterized membrane protein HdeD (DUF308 family)
MAAAGSRRPFTAGGTMESAITGNWWVVALRGVAGILLGIAAFLVTGITLAVLIALFAAYLFVDGVLAILAGSRGRSWLIVAEGVVGVIAGFVALLFPALTALALAILIAVWAILTGIAELAAAIRLRRMIRNEWLLGLSGIISIVFGVLIALFPGAGLVAIVLLIGAYALVWGVLNLALAFRLRGSPGSLMVAP